MPVITAIGHKDDVLLCSEVSDADFITPTEAAEQFNKIKSDKRAEEKQAYNKRRSNIGKRKYASLQEENTALKLELAEITNFNLKLLSEIEALKLKNHQLEQNNKKGFFSRLFGF
jgi:exonuclease VII large subunit